MAASALAAAAAEYGSDEEEPDEDEGWSSVPRPINAPISRLFSLDSFLSDDGRKHSDAYPSSPPVKLGGKKRTIPSTVSLSIGSMRGSGSSERPSTFALSQGDMDGTIDVLVSILQDPDHGVPRALDAALKDLKVKRGLHSHQHTSYKYCTHTTSTHHTNTALTPAHITQTLHSHQHTSHKHCTHTSTHCEIHITKLMSLCRCGGCVFWSRSGKVDDGEHCWCSWGGGS